ncbi:LysM domain-containing protein [Catenulispora yoronensis]
MPTATAQLPDGRSVTYVRRRFVPKPEDLTLLREHAVVPGERLDTIAFTELGAAELAWQLADANRAVDPGVLAVPGRRLRITLPASLGANAAALGAPGAGPSGMSGLPGMPGAAHG